MGVSRQQKATWPMRGKMSSPGRPPGWQREQRQRFWIEIAKGTSSEDAAVAVGVASAVGCRWFRDAGGMRPISLIPLSGRYLSLAEREEIAILKAGGCGVREIARQLGRSPSTISRELRRNAATRSGSSGYRAITAQWHADRRAKRPKVAKLAANPRLRDYVQDRLDRTGRRRAARRSDSSAAAMGGVRIVAGAKRGVLSRSPTDSASTSPMMRPCASRTRPSIRPCSSRGEGRCAGSSSLACGLDGLFECLGPGLRVEARSSSRLR